MLSWGKEFVAWSVAVLTWRIRTYFPVRLGQAHLATAMEQSTETDLRRETRGVPQGATTKA